MCRFRTFPEIPGKGIEGAANGMYVTMGSMQFVAGFSSHIPDNSPAIYIAINRELYGSFSVRPQYRPFITSL